MVLRRPARGGSRTTLVLVFCRPDGLGVAPSRTKTTRSDCSRRPSDWTTESPETFPDAVGDWVAKKDSPTQLKRNNPRGRSAIVKPNQRSFPSRANLQPCAVMIISLTVMHTPKRMPSTYMIALRVSHC